jgi:hypothetical protein
MEQTDPTICTLRQLATIGEVAGLDGDEVGAVDEAAECDLDGGGGGGGDALFELRIPGEGSTEVKMLSQVGGQSAIGNAGDFPCFQEADLAAAISMGVKPVCKALSSSSRTSVSRWLRPSG